MADFDKTFDRTVTGFEVGGSKTGYSNAGTDKGGETYKGISRNANPKWYGWFLIDSLKVAFDFPACLEKDTLLQRKVYEFYKELWVQLKLTTLPSQSLADAIYDFAVNSGAKTAIQFLQHCLNLHSLIRSTKPLLLIDGIIGSLTLNMIDEAYEDSDMIVKMLNCLRGSFCMKIVEQDQSQAVNLHSWFRRI